MKPRIPLAMPEITETDRQAVLEVLQTSDLSMGPKLKEFEQAFCEYLQVPYAVAVNSGTSALHLAFRLLDLPPGSEVILPSFAFAAPLNVLLQERLCPVFVDIDPNTFNTTPELVETAITERTRAIIAIHTFGRPVDGTTLRTLADSRRIILIEDACEALGAELNGRKAGTFGHIGIFAFYPNKQITTGEGGVLVTTNRGLAERARRLRNQGRDSSLNWFQQTEIGFSYRLSEMNCALGIQQLLRIERILQRRQQIAQIYDHRLANITDVIRPTLAYANGRISWFVYVIQLAQNFIAEDRDLICAALTKRGIGNARYFAPLHRQPVLKDFLSVSLPTTEAIADRVIALPFYNQLTEPEINEVCTALEESIAEVSRRNT